MFSFNHLSGSELVTLANVLSIILSENKLPSEIDVMGNFFSSLGSNLSTIATAKATEVIDEEL